MEVKVMEYVNVINVVVTTIQFSKHCVLCVPACSMFVVASASAIG